MSNPSNKKLSGFLKLIYWGGLIGGIIIIVGVHKTVKDMEIDGIIINWTIVYIIYAVCALFSINSLIVLIRGKDS